MKLVPGSRPCTEERSSLRLDSGEHSVENMAPVVSAIAHERSWRIVQLFQQWLDMRSIVDVLVGQIKSNDLVTVGVDADMKLTLRSAFRCFVFFE